MNSNNNLKQVFFQNNDCFSLGTISIKSFKNEAVFFWLFSFCCCCCCCCFFLLPVSAVLEQNEGTCMDNAETTLADVWWNYSYRKTTFTLSGTVFVISCLLSASRATLSPRVPWQQRMVRDNGQIIRHNGSQGQTTFIKHSARLRLYCSWSRMVFGGIGLAVSQV